ncbi:ATP-binding cassette subfamily B multidrug efflux pump [Breoghania corrubedonensis]|uniref:ATP-binding cassette subfamily B multidrug efflux pump n=1 Tax=Breoghania corrubedonensis TaxID=665038 RepID=A0A2T5UTZ2_9HYPH|nr:ABC transporter ATP-binding protein [Breoghania corrubedonensis]PTW54970.1 ATP-binding cassette subfamily B multidrug efflux pump [Breoghania corrubedonensis]
MFAWFENLLKPFEDSPVECPPDTARGFYLYHLKPWWRLLAVTLFISLLAALAEMALFVFVGDLVDLMNANGPDAFFETQGPVLAGMAFVVLVMRPVLTLLARGLINLALVPGLTAIVRWRSYRYVQRQSLSFFQDDFAGRVAQKVMQTGMALRESVVNVVDGVWFLFIYLAGTLALFVGLDWRMALPLVLWTIGYGATILYLVPPVRARSAAVAEANSALSGRIVDSFTNIQSLKLFSDPERAEGFVLEGLERQLGAMRRLLRAIVSMTVVLTVLNSLLIVGVGALSLWLWHTGAITVGAVALANGLSIRLNQMSGWILRTVTALFENVGTVQNGIETLSRPTSVVDKPGARELSVPCGEIRFERIGFHYGKEGGVIDDLSLTIKAGEKVGVVGRSGAGKSTLVNLLLRFYDLESGRILIDGQNISDVTQDSLRRHIGMVTQDTALLHRSVHDNIVYGQPDADSEDVLEAVQRAQADGFIPELRDRAGRSGFAALVGERGVKLSGGQRQRIAIARVLLKNAPILVLDEATSALDSEVEAAIQEQLNVLMEGKTVLAIAHRLSTIAAMDRLVVMDAGDIIEQGTHRELLEAGGLYASLWERQSGGFLAQTAAA